MPSLNNPFISPFYRYPQYGNNNYSHYNYTSNNVTSDVALSHYQLQNNTNKKNNTETNTLNFQELDNTTDNRDRKNDSETKEFFEIFGLKLYFDDILLICLIFFLYKEDVHDEMLFIALILLLLS